MQEEDNEIIQDEFEADPFQSTKNPFNKGTPNSSNSTFPSSNLSTNSIPAKTSKKVTIKDTSISEKNKASGDFDPTRRFQFQKGDIIGCLFAQSDLPMLTYTLNGVALNDIADQIVSLSQKVSSTNEKSSSSSHSENIYGGLSNSEYSVERVRGLVYPAISLGPSIRSQNIPSANISTNSREEKENPTKTIEMQSAKIRYKLAFVFDEDYMPYGSFSNRFPPIMESRDMM